MILLAIVAVFKPLGERENAVRILSSGFLAFVALVLTPP